ncbi:hypothetical protein J9317_13675 [Metabacillus sp. KIGAM252]|uniref:RNA polymerase subunit sigma-70 n=1 Tax=Metabacillus flavus TaxID=2823519 RepID=A0ABS5LGS3_9BACI|nr:hypothetical protein [Metabacillus flavus]MBS2969816.1 hypothetical protein [Metabacillus flavus]
MRYSEKGEMAHQSPGNLFSADLHALSKAGKDSSSMELASEFGLTLREVRNLKKYLRQS